MQPAHDRGGHHRPDTLIDHARRTVGHPRHPGQPGHGLLDEDVARPARQTRRAGPRDHLHRQDAVATEIEEGVVDPDLFQPEDLGVDAGQDLLDRVGRRAVPIGIVVFRCGQSAGVELVVRRQRQRVEDHHRGRDHVGREPSASRARAAPGSTAPVADSVT